MMKIQFILTLCSLSQAAYISRIGNGNRIRAPTPFRPGVILHKTWTHPRVFHAASNRAPYVLYRNPPHRFPTKQYPLPGRHLNKGPWKTTARLPQFSVSTPEYEFLRAASAPPASHSDGGAIHTIPAPNLSLSEKPIVVLDSSADIATNAASDVLKPVYEVTEKSPDVVYPMPKLERPIGFSKATSLTTPKLQALIGSGAPFQLSSGYRLSDPNLHQSPDTNHQYTIQEFTNLPTQQDLRDAGADGIIIPPNALYQSDPMFVQKLQNHLLQQFPAVEFIPYAADTAQIPVQPGTSLQNQPLILLQEEDLKQEPSSFVPSIEKNIVQRQTVENNVVKVVPAFIISNITEKPQIISEPQNITVEFVSTDVVPITTTIKYVMENKTIEDTTPINYAQAGQAVGNLVAKGFYTTMNEATRNEVLNENALKQDKKSQTLPTAEVDTTTLATAIYIPEIKNNVQNVTDNKANTDVSHSNRFANPADAVNVSYTLFRAADKEPKMLHNTLNSNEKEQRNVKDNSVYAGQIVKATISEDQDFNKQKATLLLKRAPIRLLAYSGVNTITTEAAKVMLSNAVTKVSVVKAKASPKSKLAVDNKTGEPILRIYASYVNNPSNGKMADNIKRVKETIPVAMVEERKSTTVQSVDKTQGHEGNQVTKFGLKLRLRKEDYVPFFEGFDK